MSGQIEPAGMEIKIRVEKSRVCRPFRTATLRLDLDSMVFDETFEMVKAAKHYGIIDNPSVGRYEYEGHKMHGERAVRNLLDGKPRANQEDSRHLAARCGPLRSAKILPL